MPKINTSLNPDNIQQMMPAGNLHYFNSIDSTNTWLLMNGQCHDICISSHQKKGKGRRGNYWISPANGNIYFSLCWCFPDLPRYWSLLGLMVGIATAKALYKLGLRNHGIKWPNDIFWKGKKLGGILLETTDQSGRVIIGIGLNTKQPENHLLAINQPVTSLEESILHKPFSSEECIIYLIKELYHYLDQFIHLNFDDFIKEWQQWDILHNQPVQLTHQGKLIHGTVSGIDETGRIGIQTISGAILYLSSAEIKLIHNLDKT